MILRETYGSSPLARGLLSGAVSEHTIDRIIPARAGFTIEVYAWDGGWRDHPRSRGVYRASPVSSTPCIGSSPLARGLRFLAGLVAGRARIIPARAGFTRYIYGGDTWRKDHPRSRGVYISAPSGASTILGSSPLARGLLTAHSPTAIQPRIIPARAGFTCQCPVAVGKAIGSSPLARGLRDEKRH